jgi:phosphate starvation-inducible PhoH-like protein
LTESSACISFDDNSLIPILFGEHNKYLSHIEKELLVTTFTRGGVISVMGDKSQVMVACSTLRLLYGKLEKDEDISMGEVDAAIRVMKNSKVKDVSKRIKSYNSDEFVIKTPKKHIRPITDSQIAYVSALMNSELTFGVGPAGTGKTYLAVAVAANMLLEHKIKKIILCRPAVEAGEKLGFLPGDLKDKVDPYLQPLYDSLHDMFPAEKIAKYIETGEIQIAPLAFMRGRTLTDSFVILDEAQNTTAVQMKMFLTRLGEGSRMAVAGDLTQTDLDKSVKSGLRDVITVLKDVEEIKRIHFKSEDVVRHPLTAKIVEAYDKHHNGDRWGNNT